MRAIFKVSILTIAFAAVLVPNAAARFALSWTGPIEPGTLVTVHGIFAGPGRPGPVVFEGQATSPWPAPADTIWVVLGDAERLQDCTLTVLQGPLEARGADAVFTAQPGSFASEATVTVFYVWNRSLQDEAFEPTTGVYLGAGRNAPTVDLGPPGQPGPAVTSGG